MRCRHRVASKWRVNAGYGSLLRCRKCGEMLPLGPANDAPEQVRIEIRAAEIALALRQSDLTAIDWGWHGEAGYLARCIWEHDQ